MNPDLSPEDLEELKRRWLAAFVESPRPIVEPGRPISRAELVARMPRWWRIRHWWWCYWPAVAAVGGLTLAVAGVCATLIWIHR